MKSSIPCNAARGVGYETILKEQKGQSMFVENKAFSMDEPASGGSRDTLLGSPLGGGLVA